MADLLPAILNIFYLLLLLLVVVVVIVVVVVVVVVVVQSIYSWEELKICHA
jgi:hypothetical protein